MRDSSANEQWCHVKRKIGNFLVAVDVPVGKKESLREAVTELADELVHGRMCQVCAAFDFNRRDVVPTRRAPSIIRAVRPLLVFFQSRSLS